jgi:DNA repair exonuclease SbcCD ATPase subunit
MSFDWQSAVAIACLALLPLVYLYFKRHYERVQLRQVSRLSRAFREQQTGWEDERRKLEQLKTKLRSELEMTVQSLMELKQQYDEDHQQWQQARQELSEEIDRLRRQLEQAQTAEPEQQKLALLAEAERGTSGHDDFASLQERLTQAQDDRAALESQLAKQRLWAEQVQQALEDEVNRLSEQLARLRQKKTKRTKLAVS